MNQQKKLEGKSSKGRKGLPSRSASLFFRFYRNSATHRQWSQASTWDSVVEPVTPAGGGIGVVMTFRIVCEAVAGLIFFFGDSTAGGFLQTDTSSEYRLKSQTTKYKSRSTRTWVKASFSIDSAQDFLAG
jgi:hypothetical protein